MPASSPSSQYMGCDQRRLEIVSQRQRLPGHLSDPNCALSQHAVQDLERRALLPHSPPGGCSFRGRHLQGVVRPGPGPESPHADARAWGGHLWGQLQLPGCQPAGSGRLRLLRLRVRPAEHQPAAAREPLYCSRVEDLGEEQMGSLLAAEATAVVLPCRQPAALSGPAGRQCMPGIWPCGAKSSKSWSGKLQTHPDWVL